MLFGANGINVFVLSNMEANSPLIDGEVGSSVPSLSPEPSDSTNVSFSALS